MKPAPGVQVTSNIELVSPIAEGAMGSVFLCHPEGEPDKRVAVKLLGENTAR